MKRHNIEALLETVPTLIYDATHRVRWHRKLARELATALFWAAWIYWMMPLVTLVAWVAGIRLAYFEFFAHPAMGTFVETLPRYALVVLFISLVGVNWIGLQVWARRGYERRTLAPPKDLREIAAFFGISPASIEAAQGARVIVAHHDAVGRVRELTSHSPRLAERD